MACSSRNEEGPLILQILRDDELRCVARHLRSSDLLCFRLVCKPFDKAVTIDQEEATKLQRSDFVRSSMSQLMYAWNEMPQFQGAMDVLMKAAIRHGRIDALQWLCEHDGCVRACDQGYEMEEMCADAALTGLLDAIRLLRNHGCPWNTKTCSNAASSGHLEMLQWARQHGCPWDEETCEAAAKGGDFEVLRYAHEHGCPWDEWTCQAAAKMGYLEVLRYAHEHGCPWDEWTCEAAAEGGFLEILRYAHDHGCPWDEWTCRAAAANGHLEVLYWAREHGCPWDDRLLHLDRRNRLRARLLQ